MREYDISAFEVGDIVRWKDHRKRQVMGEIVETTLNRIKVRQMGGKQVQWLYPTLNGVDLVNKASRCQ